MANMGTSFLALETRRFAIGRKATAAATVFSFKLDVMLAHLMGNVKRGPEARVCDVSFSVWAGDLAV